MGKVIYLKKDSNLGNPNREKTQKQRNRRDRWEEKLEQIDKRIKARQKRKMIAVGALCLVTIVSIIIAKK
jgi:type II secretory pathway component PulM